jgi:hypothetical protein
MNPGRDLDELVATKIMGWERPQFGDFGDVGIAVIESRGEDPYDPPPYSTDIAVAWQVIEKIGLSWRGFQFGLFWKSPYVDQRDEHWHAGWFEWDCEGPEERASAIAVTAPHAICLAALETLS